MHSQTDRNGANVPDVICISTTAPHPPIALSRRDTEAVADARSRDATTLQGELAAARARATAAEAAARLGAADEARLNRLEAATEDLLECGAAEHQRVCSSFVEMLLCEIQCKVLKHALCSQRCQLFSSLSSRPLGGTATEGQAELEGCTALSPELWLAARRWCTRMLSWRALSRT